MVLDTSLYQPQQGVIKPNLKHYQESTRPARNPRLTKKTKYFTLRSDYLKGSGFKPLESQLLYCRADFKKLFSFLTENILLSNKVCYVLRSPGTGKSLATLSFLTTLNVKLWKIIWLHIEPDSNRLNCVILDPHYKKSFFIELDKVSEILNQDEGSTLKALVVLDGLNSNQKYDYLKCSLMDWRKDDEIRNHLIFAYSMALRHKAKTELDEAAGIKQFFMSSWTLDEYQEAVEDDAFYDKVKGNLDAITSEDRDALVLAKFHYAGHSARNFFRVPTTFLVAFVDQIIEDLNMGSQCAEGFNRLISQFSSEDASMISSTSIVSKHVAESIALKLGLAKIELFMDCFGQDRRATFLLYFFYQLRSSGVHFSNYEGKKESIVASQVVLFDPEEKFPVIEPGVFYKPTQIYETGFDGLFFEKSPNCLTIIRVTFENSLEFDLGRFEEIIKQVQIVNGHLEISQVKFLYAIDISKIQSFTLESVGKKMFKCCGFQIDNMVRRVGIA
jgi:hypothetical protein